jgi:LCP family protein required for cell wall assembly
MSAPGAARLRRWGLVTVAALLVTGLVAAAGLLYLQHRLASQVARVPAVFEGLSHRPERSAVEGADDALNVLLVLTRPGDSAEPPGADTTGWAPVSGRPDTLVLLHIDADRRGASLVWVPQDAWVSVPGAGSHRIADVFRLGPPSLAVATFERLSDVRVDHLAVLEWDCFRDWADRDGGVGLFLPEAMRIEASGTWWPGLHQVDGDAALHFAGESSPYVMDGPDRIRRQQMVVDAVLQATLHQSMRSRPWQAYRVLDILAGHLAVDDGWTVSQMRSLLWSLRGLRSQAIRQLTVPIAHVETVGTSRVVRLDRARGGPFWSAVRDDRLGGWVDSHPALALPQTGG